MRGAADGRGLEAGPGESGEKNERSESTDRRPPGCEILVSRNIAETDSREFTARMSKGNALELYGIQRFNNLSIPFLFC
jgi:hypothetical protein